jgi:threonine synthase
MTDLPPSSGGVIERYFEHLPVSDRTPIVSLGEGDTPLLRSTSLSAELGAEVWLKCEGLNPTGSFKDRGMAVAISKALEEGAQGVVCASTGNTSASAAAYAARAGLPCAALIADVDVPPAKLHQAHAHGARLLYVDGGFDRALELTRSVGERLPVTVVNSVNPYRIEGQKTAAFEIVAALGRAPSLHVMPVGNAGNITAYWRGYRHAQQEGWASTRPRMFGFQAAGSDPIVRGRVVASPRTVASAIRIGNPASWAGATEAAHASGGAIYSVSDDDTVAAYADLAGEGLLVELASAIGVAGLRSLAARGMLPRDALVVCVLTGHGLKNRPLPAGEAEPWAMACDVVAIADALGMSASP